MMKILKLLLFFVILLPVYSLKVTDYKLSINVQPSTVEPGQQFTLTINYYIVAKNDWYDVATGGRSIFFKVFVGDKVYRVGKSGCIATSTSDSRCDIPYAFNGEPLSGTSTFTFVAPTTEGTYTIKVEMWINRANWFDKQVTSTSTTLKVIKVVEYKPIINVTNKTEQPSEYIGTCDFSNVQIFTIPQTVFEGKPFELHIKFSYSCTRNDPYGPYLKVRIRDRNWNIIKQWRVGDQGYITDMNKNYYFSPSGGTKEIIIPNIILSEGVYYITLEGVYSDRLSFDDPIFSEYKAYTLYVNKLTETTKEQATQYLTTIGTCSGRPILVMTAWTNEQGIILNPPTAKVGDRVYATVKIKNAYTTCRFEGTLKIDIKKDTVGPDKSILSKTFDIILNPRDERIIRLEFVPSEDGEYHFDVYWNNQKYGKDDVQTRYGSITCSSLDPTGCYAGPDLKVYKSTEEIVKQQLERPKNVFTVLDYWFEQGGKRVTELVEGIPALGCVNISSSIDTTATVTVKVKAYAGMKQLGILGDVAPDPVKAQVTREVVFIANEPVKICAQFIPRQTSALHNEMYYLTVEIEGKEIGIFPESKDGAILVPRTGKGNPLITGQDERNDIIVISHGWYTEEGEKAKKIVPPGTYIVRVELMNTGGYIANTSVVVKVRADVDLWFDKDVDKCSTTITIPPNATKVIDCPFDLGDGKYHYEIYLNGKKVVSRGPSIYVGYVGFFKKYIMPVIKTIGIPGLIIFGIIFFTGPFWIPFIIKVFEAWAMLLERFRK